ncbi:MAG: AmmeMemoRadiSam system protein B [Chloroflexota bacterium]
MDNYSAICPKIRPLDFQPVMHEGEQVWLIRDPSEITTAQLLLPPILAQMTVYCDGLHDISEIYAALEKDIGGKIPAGVLEDALKTLDEAFMLDNDRFEVQKQSTFSDFQNSPFRPMALAGATYSNNLHELKQQFESYAVDDDSTDALAWEGWSGRGIVSPHIDYQRGGPVYAKTWARSKQAVADADLVLMFATDHNGGLGSLTLTEKPYETPYGILPTDVELVQNLAKAIGKQDAFRLELNHRKEHSVELSAVWLHHVANQVRPNNPPPMVPILIGSFHHFVMGSGHPSKEAKMLNMLQTLKKETAGKRVLCVASVDLSHVGPAFGDDYIMDSAKRDALLSKDLSLMDAVVCGDEERFYDEIAAIKDTNKVCGFSPLYLMLKFMGETQGKRIDYQHCSADAQDHSLVSICGLLLD